MKTILTLLLLVLPVFVMAGDLTVTVTITGIPGEMITAGQGFEVVYYDTNEFEAFFSGQGLISEHGEVESFADESPKFMIVVTSSGIPDSVKIKSIRVAINVTSDFQLQNEMVKQFSIKIPTTEVVKNDEKRYSVASSYSYNSYSKYWCTRSDYAKMGQRWVGDLNKFY